MSKTRKQNKKTYSGCFGAEVIVGVRVGQHQQKWTHLIFDVVVSYKFLFKKHQKSRLGCFTHLFNVIFCSFG